MFDVAQIANLLFRRLPIGGALAKSDICRMASCDTADWQSALQTPPARWTDAMPGSKSGGMPAADAKQIRSHIPPATNT